MQPVDIVLVEGFKSNAHPKIETHRSQSEMPLVSAENKTIIAVASDCDVDTNGLPCLNLNDVPAVADYIIAQTGLG